MKPEECICKYLTKIKMTDEWLGQGAALSKTQPDRYGYACGHPGKRRRVKRPCLPLSDLPCPITLSLKSFPER